MKNMMKKALFTFVCALAFMFVGVVTVKAAGNLENTNISGFNASYRADGSTYYYVNGAKDENKIVLKARNEFRTTTLGAAYYRASVAVVTCSGEATVNGCNEWSYYSYNTDAYKTMDALTSKDGLKIDLSKLEKTTQAAVNGKSLGSLTSFYGVESTYFVLVQYTSQKLGFWPIKVDEQTFDAEVFKVVYSEDVKDISITSEVTNGVTKVTVVSGTPISNVRYFHTASDLNNGFDFETEYTKAGNGSEVLTEVEEDPKLGNGVFKYEFSFTAENGENYYVEATNANGDKAVYDVTNEKGSNNPGNQKPGESNVGNTDIGKYILIALLVILVLSLVLVIVQRIVDYRKKLY